MGQAKWHLARAKNLLLPPCRRQPATFAASSIAGRSAKTDMSANLQVDGAAAAAAVVGNHDAAASAAATLLALSKGRISRLQQIEQRRKEIQEEAKRLSAQEKLEARKRQRLMAKCGRLSQEDLLEIITANARVQAKAKAKVKAKAKGKAKVKAAADAADNSGDDAAEAPQ